MKNALFAAIIAGFVMTSVSFAEEAKMDAKKDTAAATTTTTTTEHGKMDATAPAADAHAKHKGHKEVKKTTETTKAAE